MKRRIPKHVAYSGAIQGYSISLIPLVLGLIAISQRGPIQGLAVFGLTIIFLVVAARFKKMKWRDFEIER